MIKFKIGARVRVTGRCDGLTFRDSLGTVLGYQLGRPQPCIEFDEYMRGHDGDDSFTGKYGHCWFVSASLVSPICNCNTLGCEGECNDKV